MAAFNLGKLLTHNFFLKVLNRKTFQKSLNNKTFQKSIIQSPLKPFYTCCWLGCTIFNSLHSPPPPLKFLHLPPLTGMRVRVWIEAENTVQIEVDFLIPVKLPDNGKSDCIYHYPIDFWNQTEFRLIPNWSKNC